MQQIPDERRGILSVLIPAALTLLQCIIVQVLVLCNLAFQRNIPADHITGTVQQERRQQTAHSAVAVIERMDAEKVMDEHRDQQKRIQLLRSDHAVVALAEGFHSRCGFIRRKRREQDKLPSVRVCCADIVLGVLEAAADALVGVLIQVTVQLENIVRRDRNVFIAFVDGIQHITVAHDLFLISVARRCLITDELHQARIGRADAFDLIGCLRALHLGDLDQAIQRCGLLFQIQLLPALVFMDLCHKPQDLAVP